MENRVTQKTQTAKYENGAKKDYGERERGVKVDEKED